MGSGGKKQTVGYKYLLGVHHVLHLAPTDGIQAIYVADRELPFSFEFEGARYYEDLGMFGGDSREGGISVGAWVEDGSPDQEPNAYLQSQLGDDIPAYRGVTSVITNGYMGNNPYLKAWSFKSKRIHKKANGDEQWYDEKAEISPDYIEGVGSKGEVNYIGNLAADINGDINWGTSGVNEDGEGFFLYSCIDVTDRYIDGDEFIIEANYTIPSAGTSQVDCVFDRNESTNSAGFYRSSYTYNHSANPSMVWVAHRNTDSIKLNGASQIYDFTLLGGLEVNQSPMVSDGDSLWMGDTSRVHRFNGNSLVGSYTNTELDMETNNISFHKDPLTGRTFYSARRFQATTWLVKEYQGGDPTNVLWSHQIINGIPNFSTQHTGLYVYGDLMIAAPRTEVKVYSLKNGAPELIQTLPNYAFLAGDANPPLRQCGPLYFFVGTHLYSVYPLDFPGARTGEMNPAHIIRECLTDSVWGLGYQDADINDESFIAAADTLFDEGMGMSLVWSRQSPIEDFINEVLRHIDAALYVDRTTGQFVLKLLREDYDEEAIPTLDKSIIASVSDYARPTGSELANSVTINYTNGETGNTESLTLQDTAMIQRTGAVQDVAMDFRGFTNPEIVALVLARELRQESQSLISCTIEAREISDNLNPGDPFWFDWPAVSNTPVIMRVLDIAFGNDKSKRVRISAVQDAFALPGSASLVKQELVWTSPIQAPTPAQYRLVIEAPYYELVQRFGQTTVDQLLSDNPEMGFVQVAAVRPGNAINADFIVDAGAGYDSTNAVTLDFCPTATLSAGVGYLDTAWTIESGINLDLVVVGTHAQINDELFRVDTIDVDAGTLTVGRGVLDTVPGKHLAGDRILFWDAYSESDETEYADGEEVSVKILPATGKGMLDIDDATADSLTFDQRAVRPYPPADVQISGAYYPAILTGAINITWVGRDRTQQTSGTLYDYFDANIGPESGVIYNGYIYDDDTDALLYSATGIVSPWSVPVTEASNVRIELESERDGITSLQKFSHIALLAEGYGGATRITQSGDVRITQSGDTRITED